MPRLSVCVCVVLMTARAVAGQSITPGVAVNGVVLDQTGGALQGAAVELATAAGTREAATTDGRGEFHFTTVPPGTYELRVAVEGFKQSSSRVRVTARAPSLQRIVLSLADLEQNITVTNNEVSPSAAASTNLDAISVDQGALDTLPTLDQDLIGAISRFLDPASLGSGGPTIVVNGMEVSALSMSASAVQQIKVNQDPYSAEYARPGRGRIEILTKPGGQTYEGEANVIARDARFDARNAFATTRRPEQKRIFEGVLGGPLGRSGKTWFTLSASDNSDDQQTEVFAVGPDGAIHDVVPQQTRDSLVSLGITRQWSERTTISLRPAYKYELSENRGVGGTTLASAGATFTHHEQQVTYTQQNVLRPSLVHQFQILVGHEREPTLSASSARGIVVAGAFTSGSQGDLILTEVHAQLTDSVVWIRGRHQVQAGFQLPDWSLRGFLDRTNVNGTYYFSGLDTYAAARPYSFTEQQGNGDLTFLEKQVGTYIKDDWQLGPGVSLSFGVRYDWQNHFHDTNNVAPRGSIAFAPQALKHTVIRAGLGIFNDRSGAAAIADLLHAQPGGLVRYVISNPAYPDPFPSRAAGRPPSSTVQLAPGVQIPQTLQYSAGMDRELRKGLTLSITFNGARGYNLFRSRDINAPLPPLYGARPDAAFGAIREIESDGRQTTTSLQATLRGKLGRWFNGQTQYTWSRADNDTNGITSYPANDYDLSGEWGRADFDRRHRLVLLGSLNAVRFVDIGVALTTTSEGPYTESLGPDIYNNGRGRARPAGVERNSLDGAAFAQLDVRVSRTLKSRTNARRAITLALDAFNVFDRVNYGTFVGTVGSPLFGQPVSARAPRQLQFSARVRF